MKKIFYLIIATLLLSFFNCQKVNAETAKITYNSLGNYFHAKYSNGSFSKYGQILDYRVSSGTYSGKKAYCIAPAETQSTSASYTIYNYNDSNVLDYVNDTQSRDNNKLTKEQLDMISYIAYYGYGYSGHNTNNHILATQMLIYRVVENQVFTDMMCSRDCSKITDPPAIASAMQEIQDLVDNHFVLPSFNNNSYQLKTGETLEIQDANGVLGNFKVDSCDNCTASISNNKLYITPKDKGDVQISLAKGNDVYNSDTLFFTSTSSQNMIVAGNIDPVYSRIRATATGGSVEIEKSDVETGTKLANAKFEVYNSNDAVVCTLITNSSGVASCTNLANGSYYLKEVSAPNGYVLDTKKHSFNISANNVSFKLSLTNEKIKGSVSINKSDVETNEKLANAKFGVYDSSDTLVCTLITNSSGTASCSDLVIGNYYLKELQAPTNYVLDGKKYNFTISSSNVNINLNLTNEKMRGSVSISKVDSETNEKLANAKFGVYDTNDKLVCTLITNSSGTASCNNIVVGNYYLKEIEAPTDYVLDIKKHNFTISPSNIDIKIDLTNEKMRGTVSISKVDSETNEKLANAKFGVYDTNDKLVCTLITNSSGTASCNDIIVGNYYIKEIEAPTGYLINDKKHIITISSKNLDIKLELKNDIIKGSIEVYKLDNKNGKERPQGDGTLAGAKFGIYKKSDNTLVTTVVTDEKGYAKYDGLPYGQYYVKEIEAPRGYKLARANYLFNIDVHNEVEMVGVINTIYSYDFNLVKTMSDGTTGVIKTEADAEFDIYLVSQNKLVGTLKTDSNGKANITLPYGVYSVCQTKGNGYTLLADCFEVNLTNGNVDKVVNNEYIKAKLKVIKVDQNNNNISLKNIKFKIKDLDTNKYVCQTTNKKICEFVTDKNGILITPLPLLGGTYKLEEVDQAIDGYLWNKEPLKFTIDENSNIKNDPDFGAILEVKFINNEVFGSIIINKIGEEVKIDNGKISYIDNILKDVKFEIYDKSNKLISTIATDEKGIAKIDNLKLGKYFIKEIVTKDNYILDENIYEVELKYKDQYTSIVEQTITIKNYLKKGSLEFTKKDLTTGESIPNVKFQIYTDNDELIFDDLTNENGSILLKALPVGKYYIVEVEPAVGYILNTEKVLFEIKENNEVVKAELSNELIKSKIRLTKSDTDGNLLSAVKFNLYNCDDELLGTFITDDNGVLEIILSYGKYYLKEIETKAGYVLSAEKLFFEVKENDETIEINVTNKKIEGVIRLLKVGTDNIPLENVKFDLFSYEDEWLGTYCTDSNGILELKLIYGRYYLKEKETLNGYILSEEKIYFEIFEEDQIIDITFKNDEEVKVPPTSVNDSVILNVVVSLTIVVGLGFLVYDKAKKK